MDQSGNLSEPIEVKDSIKINSLKLELMLKTNAPTTLV